MAPVSRKSYTVKQKIEIVAQRKSSTMSGRQFAQSLGLGETTIRRWMTQEKDLLKVMNMTEISTRSIRKIPRKKVGHFPDIDAAVHRWVLDRNKKGIRVKDTLIQMYAAQVKDRIVAAGGEKAKSYESFGASKIWCYRFKKRFNLVSKRHTTAHKLPSDFRQSALDFIRSVQETCTKYDIKRENIVNFDQVPRYFEASRRSTIITKGTANVPLGKCGNSHKRFTFTPFIDASGRMLIKHVLFAKLVNVPKHHPQCSVSLNTTGMWNEKIVKQYVDEAVRLSRGVFGLTRYVLIILDSYGTHTKFVRERKEEYYQQKVLFAIIPPGLTGLLQPLDVCLNRSFQQFYDENADKYRADSIRDDTNKTLKGNIKMPSPLLVTQWVMSWCSTFKDAPSKITKAFDTCGLVPAEFFDPQALHKPLQDIYNINISLEQWIAKHGATLSTTRLTYDDSWQIFEGKYAFQKALQNLFDKTRPAVESIAMMTNEMIEMLSADELTATIVTEEDKDMIEQGVSLTHGNFEAYAASRIFKSELHIIIIDDEDTPKSRVIFGEGTGDIAAFYIMKSPLKVLLPPTYDPNEHFFIHENFNNDSDCENEEEGKSDCDEERPEQDELEEHLDGSDIEMSEEHLEQEVFEETVVDDAYSELYYDYRDINNQQNIEDEDESEPKVQEEEFNGEREADDVIVD